MSEVAGLMCCRYALKSNMLFGALGSMPMLV